MKLAKLIVSICMIASISINAQMKDVKVVAEKITDNLYMLKGRGGNIGLFVGNDGVFMIDDQFASLTPKILKAIKEITPKPVNYLVNTHWHGDHTGGNANMQNEGAVIVSHKNVRKRMSVDQVVWGKKRPASPKEALPVITFTDDMQFHLNGEEILVTHIHKAHTDGDAIVYFTNSNVLHVGDAYFQGKFPYIDLNSGGSIDGYINGIKKMMLIADKDTKIIPGHGKVSNEKELESYLKMLVDLKISIENEIKEGKTLEEVKKNSQITKAYKEFSGWITEERIRETIYKSLKDNK
ncbi:metallo-beta-lactamase [Tenacibaculum holothuriorum]|uniref:Metallo-beta-lactamase n=1 Tax=Tenacibaculum holothuriorum TaxID=1635173 RepID=A0A1Y2PD60_9FLAO|nr:MBL fold metallo-hydrolase [Tenacibaculum holothuriorum]OSY87679.1 metallo-beta-lactamase [Tenacibaculum holothuriorum]